MLQRVYDPRTPAIPFRKKGILQMVLKELTTVRQQFASWRTPAMKRGQACVQILVVVFGLWAARPR